jgi:hypothetical protein
MNHKLHLMFGFEAVLGLSNCSVVPTGPGILVLQRTVKSFDQFRLDEADCKHYASAQVSGNTPNIHLSIVHEKCSNTNYTTL